MILDVYLEQYEFRCRQCDHGWQDTYEAREVEDEQGDSWHHYSVARSPVASPAAGVCCPNCKQPTATCELVDRRRVPREEG
jgi:Zn finger protein HypA/HybF involved in hydrogenase expression